MITVKSLQSLIALSLNLVVVLLIARIQQKVKNRKSQFALYALVIIAFALITVFCNSTTFRTLMDNPERFLKLRAIIMNAFQKVIYITGFSTLFFMIRNLKELRFQKKQALEAQKLASESQLKMLQQQINPHFLFNALNSLRNLISADPQKARTMVTNISDFLRETLQSDNQSEIPISEELKMLQNYLDIQKIRFGEDLKVDYRIEPGVLNMKVPAFILQPLAENAIKHGMTTNNSLRLIVDIQVQGDELILSIKNNGRLAKHELSLGKGNTNIQERLKILYNGHSSFSLAEKEGFVHSDIRIKTSKL